MILSGASAQPDIRGMYPPIGNSDHNVAVFEAWAAQPGGVGDNVPPTYGTSGVQRGTGGGPMKMIFASTADSLNFSTVQVTEFQLPDSSRHLPS